MGSEYKLLAGVIILAFIIRVIFVFSSSIIWWDESIYSNLGFHLSQHPFDYSFAHTAWSDFIPSKNSVYSWPAAGFRAPFFSYFLSIFYFFKLDFFIKFLMPIIGSICVFLVFILGNILFNKRVGLIASIFAALLPIGVFYSSKILTDIFSSMFLLISFICFWKGFEENSNKYKIFFGFFLAISLLSRYTILWILPVFLIYLTVRDRGFIFLKDKFTLYSIICFFATLTPIFIYSYLQYGNFLGAFIHGYLASYYWGGNKNWSFYFLNWFSIFSLIGIIFIFSLFYIFYKRYFTKKNFYFLLISIAVFLIIASLAFQKEDRILIPISGFISIISAFILNFKNYKKFLLLIMIGLVLFISYNFYYNYNFKNESDLCFLKGVNFLKEKQNSIIITDESPVVYYYTKKASYFFFSNISNFTNSTYILYSDYDNELRNEDALKLKEYLDRRFLKVFECSNNTIIYKAIIPD